MIFYVRDLAPAFTESDLEKIFRTYGEVASVTLLESRGTPLGVGIVDMPESHAGGSVLDSLVGVQIDGNDLNVGAPRAGSDRRHADDRRLTFRGSENRRASDRRLSNVTEFPVRRDRSG